jgi:hypothetical protein
LFLKLDVDAMMRTGAIEPGTHVGGEMTFRLDDDELAIEFESSAGDPGDSWLRLRYAIRDYWTGDSIIRANAASRQVPSSIRSGIAWVLA